VPSNVATCWNRWNRQRPRGRRRHGDDGRCRAPDLPAVAGEQPDHPQVLDGVSRVCWPAEAEDMTEATSVPPPKSKLSPGQHRARMRKYQCLFRVKQRAKAKAAEEIAAAKEEAEAATARYLAHPHEDARHLAQAAVARVQELEAVLAALSAARPKARLGASDIRRSRKPCSGRIRSNVRRERKPEDWQKRHRRKRLRWSASGQLSACDCRSASAHLRRIKELPARNWPPCVLPQEVRQRRQRGDSSS
jgi:hypothetical protein